jgi:hypothetical protein
VLDTPTSWSLVVKPDSIPLGPLSRYAESFNKDGSETTWKLRRDLSVAGRSYGQMFYTACGTLILRWAPWLVRRGRGKRWDGRGGGR